MSSVSTDVAHCIVKELEALELQHRASLRVELAEISGTERSKRLSISRVARRGIDGVLVETQNLRIHTRTASAAAKIAASAAVRNRFGKSTVTIESGSVVVYGPVCATSFLSVENEDPRPFFDRSMLYSPIPPANDLANGLCELLDLMNDVTFVQSETLSR